MSPALEGGFLTTGSPGKSWTSFFLSFPIQNLPLIQFRKTVSFLKLGLFCPHSTLFSGAHGRHHMSEIRVVILVRFRLRHEGSGSSGSVACVDAGKCMVLPSILCDGS